MVKIISIAPRDIFHFRWFLYIFLLSLLLLLIALIVIVIYISQIRSVTDSAGKKLYTYPSHTLLYLTLSSSIVSLVLSLVLFFYYVKIFQLTTSTPLYTLVTLILLNLMVTGVVLYFLFAVKSYCPHGQEYSNSFDRCVPICPPGSLLDEEYFVCIQGCKTSSDCPDDQLCLLGECCDTTTHTVVQNQCCLNSNVHCLTDADPCPSDQQICCSSNVVCKDKDGNPTICCIDPDAKCVDRPDRKGQFCAVPCGNDSCGEDQLCLQTDVIDGTPTFSCESVDVSKCTKTGSPTQYYPPALNNFYPAYTVVYSDKVDPVLTCNPYTDKSGCENAIKDAFTPEDESSFNKFGWICGSSTPVNFEYHQYSGDQQKCPKQFFLQALAIPGVTDKADLQYTDGNNVYFNIRNDRSETRSTNGLGTQPITSFKTTQPQQLSSTVMSSKPTHTFVKGTLAPPKSLSRQDYTPCTDTNVYRQSCQPYFEKCEPTNQCPFNTDEGTPVRVECLYEDGTGVIKDEVVVINRCRIVNGNVNCSESSETEDEKKLKGCQSDDPCDTDLKVKYGTYRIPIDVAAACLWYGNQGENECSDVPEGEPQNSWSNMKCTNNFVPIVSVDTGKCDGDGGSGHCGSTVYSSWMHYNCCDPVCLKSKIGNDVKRLSGNTCKGGDREPDTTQQDWINECCGEWSGQYYLIGTRTDKAVTSENGECASRSSAGNNLQKVMCDFNSKQLNMDGNCDS